MLKIIHCADLHLSSSEKEYSFSVFSELIDIANIEKADYFLFAGDTFNSFDEIKNLKNDFVKGIQRLRNECEVFMLAGNHEDIGRGVNKIIGSFDLGIPVGNIIDTDSAPFRLIELNDMELLAIPHQKDYKGYTDWEVPPKIMKWRIALTHASNDDLTFTGIEEEEDKAGVIDSDLFQRFHVDYAAMGHIHKSNKKPINNIPMAYPGSPRVCRKDESGPRCINILECSSSIKMKTISIKAAGQFRKYTVKLNLEGKTTYDIKESSKEWGPNDWIWIELQGLVEDSIQVDTLIQEYRREFEGKVRRLNIDRDTIDTCSGIATQETAKKFLELWESKKPANIGDELDVWQRARELGLKKIKLYMEARS